MAAAHCAPHDARRQHTLPWSIHGGALLRHAHKEAGRGIADAKDGGGAGGEGGGTRAAALAQRIGDETCRREITCGMRAEVCRAAIGAAE